jgi:transglutaminase-like putative cysteine protease
VDWSTLDFVAAKSAELVSPGDSPLVRARKLFLWMRTHIRYTSAETQANDMADTLRVVLRDGKANCAPQSFLYAALLRTNPAPIPARVVCGQWMAHGKASTHHWVEFYLEGVGWIPADLTLSGDPLAGFGQTTASHLPSRAITQLPACIEHLWQLPSYKVTTGN